MSAPPFMPLYLGEYFADTVHLSALEHGAYFLLLTAMWRAGGRLPSADANLAKLARMTMEEWAGARPTLMPFFTRRGGHITQKRLAAELAKYESTILARSNAGKMSAAKKSRKINDADGDFVEPLNEQRSTNQNQNYNQKKEVESVVSDETTPRARMGATIDLLDDFPKGAFGLWYANYPHKVGKDAAARAFEAIRTGRRATFAELETGLRFYLASKPPDRSWCNPATWLNQGRWKDQPAFVETANGPRHANGSSAGSGSGPAIRPAVESLLRGAMAAAERGG